MNASNFDRDKPSKTLYYGQKLNFAGSMLNPIKMRFL